MTTPTPPPPQTTTTMPVAASAKDGSAHVAAVVSGMLVSMIPTMMEVYIWYTILFSHSGGQDNLIAVFVSMLSMWLLALLASCYGDELAVAIMGKNKKKRTASSSDSSYASDLPPPCTRQYNQYIIHAIGCGVYTIAMVLLSRSVGSLLMTMTADAAAGNDSRLTTNVTGYYHPNPPPPLASIDMIHDVSSSLSWFQMQLQQHDGIGGSSSNNNNIPNMLSLLLSSLRYVYYTMVMLHGYHNMKQEYEYLFVTRDHRKPYYKKLCYPLPFLAMIAIQRWYQQIIVVMAAKADDEMMTMTIIVTGTMTPVTMNVLGLLFVNAMGLLFVFYKLLDYIHRMQLASSSKEWTLPLVLQNTPFGISLQQNHWYQTTMTSSSSDETDPAQSAIMAGTSSATNVWRLYGKEYDLTDFVPHHPGGVEAIMLAANRHDATALFQSYHPFTIHKAKAILSKYDRNPTKQQPTQKQEETDDHDDDGEKKIEDDDATVQKVTEANLELLHYPSHVYHENDEFYTILCHRVYDTMKQQYGIDLIRDGRATTMRSLWYFCMIAGNATFLYAHCQGYVWGSILLGIFGVTLGSMGHDGGHFAVSHKAWINNIAVWGIYLSVNPIMWQHQHTYAHHCYTNEVPYDPDVHHFDDFFILDINKFLRNPKVDNDSNNNDDASCKRWDGQYDYKTRAIMFAYTMFRFCFLSLGACHLIPMQFIIDRSMYGCVEWTDRKHWARTILFICHWIIHTTLFMILPFYVHREQKIYAWISMMTFFITSGLYFGFFTQVGHLTEGTYEGGPNTQVNRQSRHAVAQHSWAAEQIEHTNNFCPQNVPLFLFAGGLGLQIEHHLFPGLNHCHLMKIQPIVQQICREYNVKYQSYDSWSEAMRDCLTFYNTH